MLSVLIPVYNFAIEPLVSALHQQLIKTSSPFEIIAMEDGSDEGFMDQNAFMNNLENCQLLKIHHNQGRIKTRQSLAEQAKYDWLLFLDADTMPTSDKFIENYLSHINTGYDAIFGGFAYSDIPPNQDYLLRWKYGRMKEQKSASECNKNPYKVIISANFLVKRDTFLRINASIGQIGYGLDNYFGALLKMNKIAVLHIDNEVFHLGIETSEAYLGKKEKAAEMLLKLSRENKINSHNNDLLALFEKLKKWGMVGVFSSIYGGFHHSIRKNLLSANPNIKLLQLYRISYMCHRYQNFKE